MPPPDVASDYRSQDHHAFPEPYRAEYRPITPFDETVQSKSKQRREYHQACVYQKFTEI